MRGVRSLPVYTIPTQMRPNIRMSKNLEDIARMAGVSRSTVSRVINNQPHVSEATRQRVLEVVSREGYIPNMAARTLVTQRTYVLGFMTPQTLLEVFADPYFPTVIQGVATVADRRNYAVMLWVGEGAEEENRFYNRIRHTGLIEGVILASVIDNDPIVEHLKKDDFPFVLIGRSSCRDAVSVDIENRHAARIAVEHLIQLGYRHIGAITGPMDMSVAQDRLQGYRDALRRAGRSIDSDRIVHGSFTEHSGYTAMKTLLRRDVDAAFCASDMIAVGALRAIHEEGRQVPGDVALVGFDDMPIAAALSPPLTTMRQPIRQLGSAAAEALINLLEGKLSTPYRALLPTELIVRESCGALRRRT